MKRLFIALAFVIATIPAGSAAERTWVGVISDSHCGAEPHQGEHKGKKVSDRECIIGIEGDPSYKSCLAYGAKFVLVSEGKVMKISNQDFADLKVHAAYTVRLTGDLIGDTITVTKIERAAAK